MEESRRVIGWREWVALPELGLPAIEAKVDTGAQTSALHTFAMDLFEEDGRRRVCFGVHPLADDEDVVVYACADVLAERIVVSSNGQEEHRVVVRSLLSLGGDTWPVELTLSDRSLMRFRMLLGREALAGHFAVDPAREHVMGEVADPRALFSDGA